MGLFRRFKEDQKGATAMIFGAAMLPLMGMVGVAVEFTRATMERSKMQNAVDQAAIAIVKLPQNASQATIDKIAVDAIQGMFGATIGTRTESGLLLSAPRVTRAGKRIDLQPPSAGDIAQAEPMVVLAAAKLGVTRLIDNLEV